MSLVSKQSCKPSKYSSHHPQYPYPRDKLIYESTFCGTNYESYEKCYYRQPEFFNCRLQCQSVSELDENYSNDLAVQKNVSVTSLCEHCLRCSVTSSVRDLNTDLYRPLPINSQDLIISNLNSDSDGEHSSGTYLKSNATMNKTLPNISSGECNVRECRLKKSGSCSSSMTSGRELTPTALRIGRQALCNNFIHDHHQGDKVGEKDKVNSQEEESQHDDSTDCDLVLKASTIDLVNSKFQKFNDVQCQTFAEDDGGETFLSFSELDKSPVGVMKKKQNRFPFTICDNNEKYLKTSYHNCESNVTAMNINQNSVETIKNETNSLMKVNTEKFDKLSSTSRNKLFRSWMKGITGIFSSPVKKKHCTEENLNIEILFKNNQCPYSSSEMNINNQTDYCNCYENRMESYSTNRLIRLNRDDLWIQDIVPVNDSNNTDSRYSLFLVKEARDKITSTNSSEIDPPSAKQCAKCQYLSVAPSLAIDTNRHQSIENSSNRKKKMRSHPHRKLSQQCFCFRMWQSFCQESKKPVMKNT